MSVRDIPILQTSELDPAFVSSTLNSCFMRRQLSHHSPTLNQALSIQQACYDTFERKIQNHAHDPSISKKQKKI